MSLTSVPDTGRVWIPVSDKPLEKWQASRLADVVLHTKIKAG